jgi:hypothetical protein
MFMEGEFMFKKTLMSFGFVAMIVAGPTAEATDYDFTLTNASSGYVITGFATLENGRWSRNWLNGRVRAGQSVSMHWATSGGDCVVPFRVSWEGHPDETFNMDWCARTVRELRMQDTGFTVR